MLTEHVKQLHERAKELRQGDWSDGVDDARLMDDAANTIENLRNRLTETCELEINTDMTAIKCSGCGYVVPKGTNLMSVKYCAGCGRQVV